MLNKTTFRKAAFKYWPIVIKIFKLPKTYQKILSLVLENKGDAFGRTKFASKQTKLIAIQVILYRDKHHTEYEVYSTLVHEMIHIVLWRHRLPFHAEEPIVRSMEQAMRRLRYGFKTKK